MIIGFDAKRAFRNFTGLGNYSRSTVRMLSEFYPDNNYILYTPPYALHPEHCFAERDNIQTVQPQGMYKRFPPVWRSYGIAPYAKRDKVQLFHGLSGELPTGLAKRNIRSIVTIHDLIFIRYPQFYHSVDRRIYRQKFKFACENADLIIAISKQTRQDIIDFWGIPEEKIRLVYQGCDPQFYATCSDGQKQAVAAKYQLPQRFILYVGTIEERKNLNTIIRALASLPDTYSLLAVGKPTVYMKEVNAEIHRFGLTGRVHFIHKVIFRDLPAIYQQAEVFVLPSVFEGFGIPVLEALNSKIPVITSNVSSLPEAGGAHSIYINPADSRELEQALLRLFANNELRNSMITNGYQHALNFREEKIAAGLWNVYTELIGTQN
jgi:glycosyltransferase involved in cell wall biosynthesis